MDEDDILAQAEEIDAEIEKEEKNPFPLAVKLIIALFFLLIIVSWVIPHYAIPYRPRPTFIPSVAEVLPANLLMPNNPNSQVFSDYFLAFDPTIKQVATSIAARSGCGPDRVCQAEALYLFVRDNFQYVADPIGKDYYEYPQEFMNSGGGDCESGVILLISLERAIGIQAEPVFIPNHVFVRLLLPEAQRSIRRDGDNVYVDWTCSSCEFGEVPKDDLLKMGK